MKHVQEVAKVDHVNYFQKWSQFFARVKKDSQAR